MEYVDITIEEYLDFLYDAGDGWEDLNQAYDAAYINIRCKYGRYVDLNLPYLPDKDRQAFEDWFNSGD